MLKKIISEPLVHFLLFSLIIFILFNNTEIVEENYKVIVSEGRVEQLKNDILLKKQRPHVEQELDIAIESYALNEIYLREARELGLDKGDRVIDRRLRQKMEFLLDEMASIQEPSNQELKGFYQANIDNYLTPYIYTFKQVFISTDDDAVEERIKTQQQRIAKGLEPQGDFSILPSQINSKSLQLVVKDFGEKFSQQLADFQTNQWIGPIESGFGKHFVFIEERQSKQAIPLPSIKEKVTQDWQYFQRQKFKQAYESELWQRYVIEVSENINREDG